MARYLAGDVITFLRVHGCEHDGDRISIGMGWFAPDGHPFVLPDPVDGYFNADLVDEILRDRWIWPAAPKLKKYDD